MNRIKNNFFIPATLFISIHTRKQMNTRDKNLKKRHEVKIQDLDK